MRKAFDDFLFWLLPNYWVPLYNSVSFTHMPYKKCIDNRAWQDKTLNKALKYGTFVAACALTFGAFKVARNNSFDWSLDAFSSKF
jgi:kynurenine 3-monooxygenase